MPWNRLGPHGPIAFVMKQNITANYTVVEADGGGIIRSNGAAIAITLPDNTAFADGFAIGILNVGSGPVTVAPDTGVSITMSTDGTQSATVASGFTVPLGGHVWCRKLADTTWDAFGTGLAAV